MQLSENELEAVKVKRLTGTTSSRFEGCSARISGLAYQSIAVTFVPTSLRTGGRQSLVRSMLSNTFGDKDVLLVQWVLGNSLINAVNTGILFLYGAESGKSTTVAISTIMSSLPGVCTAMFRDLLGNPKARLSDAEKADLLRRQIVTYGDVQIGDGKLNTAIWDIRSGDSVAIGSEHLLRSREQLSPAYLKRWFAHRTLVIRLRKAAIDMGPPKVFRSTPTLRSSPRRTPDPPWAQGPGGDKILRSHSSRHQL